ncbi:MAG: hypothetical protein ABJO27_00195 [Pseudoruegeria sp.]
MMLPFNRWITGPVHIANLDGITNGACNKKYIKIRDWPIPFMTDNRIVMDSNRAKGTIRPSFRDAKCAMLALLIVSASSTRSYHKVASQKLLQPSSRPKSKNFYQMLSKKNKA